MYVVVVAENVYYIANNQKQRSFYALLMYARLYVCVCLSKK